MPILSDRRNNNARLAEGVLTYLVSVGLVAAATIVLFSFASVSLLGTSKETPTLSHIDNNPIEDKLIGPVSCADVNAAPVPVQPKSSSSREANNLPSSPPVPPPSGMSREETVAEPTFKPPPDGETSAAAVETPHGSMRGPSTEETPPPELSESQHLIAQPLSIADETSGAQDSWEAAMPMLASSGKQRDPMFRDFEIQRNHDANLDEDRVALHENAPAQHVKNGLFGHRLSGFNATFRYRVRKECGPIHDPALYHQCVATFSAYRQ
jgi:hypothetical protein